MPKRDDNKSNLSYDQKVQTQYPDKKSGSKNDDFIFLYYADSRGQPFSNWQQKKHEKFVSKMLENEINNNVKHLIFGGDNVWLGFLDGQWNRFFKIMEQFIKKDIKIYPSLGNHELILARFLYAVKKWYEDKENFTVRRIAAIEEKRELEYLLSEDIETLTVIMTQLTEIKRTLILTMNMRRQ